MVSHAVFDTNILVDRLANHPVAIALIDSVEDGYVSRISYIEVMVGVNRASKADMQAAKAVFDVLKIIELDQEVGELSILARQDKVKARKKPRSAVEVSKNKAKGKLPDAIIHATALYLGVPLYTRDGGILPVSFVKNVPILQAYKFDDSVEQHDQRIAIIKTAPSQNDCIEQLEQINGIATKS